MSSTGSRVRAGPGAVVVAAQVAALAGACALAALRATDANWDLVVLAVLFVFSVASDLMAARVPSEGVLKVSGSFLALVMAMVLLGAAPATLLGVMTMAAGRLKWRGPAHYFLTNLAMYAWFPLAGGLLYEAIGGGLDPSDARFPLAVVATFALALLLNFAWVAAYSAYMTGGSVLERGRRILLPLLPWQLVAALLAVGMAYVARQYGSAALVLFGVLLLSLQHLLASLLVSEQRADDLRQRMEQLASLQLGLLSAMLRTLDLRDRMTARHSAAVARYSREIAREAGLSDRDQDLVHTAALLHDIGKLVFPDHILAGESPLDEEDWAVVRQHPQYGADVLSSVEGYGPVSEIVLSHHERLDGTGYPRGLAGEEIPELARIISVADTYDVMTARDSYRQPVSSEQAIEELRRVSGGQLDGRFVAAFVRVLAGKGLRYRHGEDADFDAELELERRVHEYAGSAEAGSAQAAGSAETIYA